MHPLAGCYRSTSNRKNFPVLSNANPITPSLDSTLKHLFQIIDNYEDVFYYQRQLKAEKVRELYSAHALNHSLKSRKLVMKNNARAEKSGLDDSLRDQGFHRARVLILLPTREAARRTVHQMLRLMPKGSTVSHRKRFERDFGPQEGQTDREKRKGKKPADYEEWFSSNCDDKFRIGISVSKKSVKLYSAFADSDIILASPLGLETLFNDTEDKTQDIQYVTASIELLIVDQAEFLLMQNWAAVQDIVTRLNQRPSKPSITSPARIRLAYLAGFGSRFRQTLLFSAVDSHLISALSSKCENFQGLNLFLPAPLYQGAFPSYLPDSHRVPGLKLPIPLANGATANTAQEIHTALDNFKLTLLTFGVSGSAASNPLLLFEKESGDDDSEDSGLSDSTDEGPEPPKKRRKQMAAYRDTLLLKSAMPSVNLTDKSGRVVPQARLAAFKQRLLPRLRRGIDHRVLIYVPDYFDLEELRNLLREESLSFCHIHEYLPDNEAERYRNLFDQGRIRIMLISERYYFFRRRKLRGARNFIFYGPPTFPWFVRELLSAAEVQPAPATNAVGESLTAGTADPAAANACSVTILYFPAWESHQVAMITGSVDV
uniref:U3 small nucleolar RNA-associated protein 25 homolog n=1 Tax=Schistocephalus solidus TaxID=70667 RepID=A0A0V0J7V9_SCHSO